MRWLSTVTGLLVAVPVAGALVVQQWWLGAGELLLPVLLLSTTTAIGLHLRKAEQEYRKSEQEYPAEDLEPDETGRLLFNVAWINLFVAVMSATTG